MMYNKKVVNGLGVLSGYAKYLSLLALIAVLAALAASSFCTHTPEYCGEEQELKPGMFCFDNKAWTKCGGDEYNPYSQFCSAGTLYEKCNGKDDYDPAREFCSGNTVVPKCGGLEYDPSRQTCDGTTIVDRHPEIPRPKYTVYFNANGATGVPPEIVSSDSGSVISLPGQAGMVKDKHSFAGWNTESDGSGKDYNAYGKYTVTRNIALFAQWTRNPYTLTINVSPPNSGTVSRNPNKETYVHGEQVTVTAAPATGNVFKGWSGASSSKNNAIMIIMDDDKTLTAGFGAPDAKQFAVYFNGNGITGGSAPAMVSADSGSKITLPGQQTMEKIGGYIFDGWTANSAGTGTNYDANASYTVTRDVTLYAKWIRFYTVTFNGNGTTVGVPEAVKADSGTLITLSAITRVGYRFDGWNTNSSGTGTNYATNFSYIVTGNVTLYAKWIPIYVVTYNGNGTTVGVPQVVTVDSGSTITLPTMTRTSYKFVGWNTNNSGTGAGFRGDSAYTVTGNVTLYARWVPVYTVTFNINNATSGTTPMAVTVDSGTVITLPEQGNIVKTRNNFGGWGTTSSGGTNYQAGSSYTVTSSTTLYARWTAYPVYTVTYNGNGATSGSVAAMSADSGSSITLPSQGTLTRTGYNFSGWNTKSDGTGTDYNAGASYSVKSDVTLYAKWSIKTYTLTTNVTPLGGGTVSRNLSANSYDHGTSVTVTATPASGYMFAGWSSDLTSNAASVVITMDGNKILTATFHRTVKIGNQTWMAENLNYQPLTGNSWCYNNSADSCNKYGRLYDWNTAKTVCPTGWHLPTRNEWDQLAEFVGGTKSSNYESLHDWLNAGKKLKSTSGWYNNGNGTDDFKFSALPGGRRNSDGSLYGAGYNGYWWAATEYGSSIAYYRSMGYGYDYVYENCSDESNGFSVRCLQD